MIQRMKNSPSKLSGNVISGLGKGAQFTQLSWAKEQFIEKLGIDPYPGTLNILLHAECEKTNWRDLPSYTLSADSAESCDASCYPVFIAGQYTGAIVVPLIDGYPEEQLEIIAPIQLREKLSLKDGDKIDLEFSHPLNATTVIFDLDGTLLDTIESFYILAKLTGDEFGFGMDRAHVYDLLNYGKSYWESSLPESLPNRQSTIDEMNKRAIALWPDVMAEHARVFADVSDTLNSLKKMGATLGIVTGSGKASVDMLYSAGVEDLVDAVITNTDVSKRKPDPEGMFKCLDQLGVAASDAMYVGDSSIDMQATRAAGMTAVAVLSGAGNSAA
ncbi:MAG: phosphoglycolate phosphatase, partial [Gammaproteobacteria bacterium]